MSGSFPVRWGLLVLLVLCAPLAVAAAAVVPGPSPVIALQEGWSFRGGDDLAWAAPDLDDGDWTRVDVPHGWRDGELRDTGQWAWYRRVVELPPRSEGQRPMGLRMGAVRNAYTLFLDGVPAGGVGRLPPDPRVNYDRLRVYPIPEHSLDDGRLVIAVRVWGGSDVAVDVAGGGLYAGPVQLGDYATLVRALAGEDRPPLVFAALFCFVGVYFLYLFLRGRSRELRAYLWFALTALALAPYVITQSQWKYVFGLSFTTLEKIESISLFLVLVCLARLVWIVLGRATDWWVLLYQGWLLLLGAVMLVVPGLEIHYYLRPLWQYAAVVVVLPLTWVVAAEALRGNRNARILAAGVLGFVPFAVNDLLVNMGLYDGPRLIPIGFLAVLGAMAMILADRFAQLLHALETEVQQRTLELRDANAALASANESLQTRSRMDPLTGLLNRRGFSEELTAELGRVERGAARAALVLLDVDFFKRFNDEHGHACGDAVLCDVAEVLRACTREVDRVGRWGGEEFVVLLPETGVDGLRTAAEKLRAAVEAHELVFEGKRLGVTATFGAAAMSDGESFEDALERADAALYRGKENGRNRVEMAD